MFASLGNGTLKLWDVTTGIPLGIIRDSVTIADDFSLSSTTASFENDIISLYGTAPIATTIKKSRNVRGLALSSNGFQIAVILEDGTVSLCDRRTGKQIAEVDRRIRWEKNDNGDAKFTGEVARTDRRPIDIRPNLSFSRTGARFAFPSDAGITLLDGISGELIQDLHSQSHAPFLFLFSDDSSRIATSNHQVVALWNCANGELIAENVLLQKGRHFAISADGSMLATGENELALWGVSTGPQLHRIHHITLDGHTLDLAFSRDVLARASVFPGVITLHDYQLSVVARLPIDACDIIAFAPNGTRLVSRSASDIHLWDVSASIASSRATPLRQPPVTTLAFSHDCSLLAAGFEDGTIKIWDTDDTTEPISTHKRLRKVIALAFGHTGRLLGSASDSTKAAMLDGIASAVEHSKKFSCDGGVIESEGGLPLMFFIAPKTGRNVVPSAESDGRFFIPTETSHLLSLSNNDSLVAFSCSKQVKVWDIEQQKEIVTFDTRYLPTRIVFSDDNSQLATLTGGDELSLYDIASNKVAKLSVSQASQLRLIPCWSGTPVLFHRFFGDVYGVSIPSLS